MVNQLIDPTNRRWKLELVNDLFDPIDATIIKSIPLNGVTISDTYGWHYTANGRYSVKSGYLVHGGEVYSDYTTQVYGPDFRILQAHAWSLKCPRKLQHFIWQVLSGSLSVNSNLKNRGIKCDPLCVRCGMELETINHALFECPPALQVWALSRVPSAPEVFPVKSVHGNMDYLFWRTPSSYQEHNFPWILWYIWKARNDKVFRNLDRNPTEVVQLAESEAMVWATAQMSKKDEDVPESDLQNLYPNFSGYFCYLDGSWKETDSCAGLGWVCYQEDKEVFLLGARNLRRSLSPLHAEFEALLWAMNCMIERQRLSVIFATDCSELVKLVSSPQDWPAFSAYLESFVRKKLLFVFFSICLIPRAQNSKSDVLAKSARIFPRSICYVNFYPPVWATEPL